MKNLDMIFVICWMATLPSFINGDDFMAARDPLGVKYYYGLDERGRMYFSSEMKSITM
jgi:asparagine synthetase B (glutamine-hydrolysing)